MRKIIRAIRGTAAVFAVFALGAILGPVVIAAVAAFSPETNQFGQSVEASKLVDAYRSRLPPLQLFTTLLEPGNGRECGYKESEIFPDGWKKFEQAMRSGTYTDYEGYYVMDQWRWDSRDKDYLARTTDWITHNIPPYQVAFLRRCIESTLLSKACAERVSRFGDRVERYDKSARRAFPGGGDEDRIVCTFVDGVAARKGIRLSRQSN